MIWLLLGILFILALAWLTSGFFLFRRVCRRQPPVPLEKADGSNTDGIRYCEEHFPEEVWIRKDELWMHAFWVDNDSDRTAVVLHGYGGHALNRSGSILYYTERGFNVLLPDLRAHGSSEGRWIGFGAPEASDAAEWVRWLRQNAQKPQRVLLHGVSMGAATALLVSGTEDLPELKLVVADCPFSDAWSLLLGVFHKLPRLLAVPALAAANLWNHLYTGNDFRRPSPLGAVANSHTPTLFIHGQKDELVPPAMSERLYEVCAAPKKLLRIPEAGHGNAFETDMAGYLAALDDMLRAYIPVTETEV